MEERAIGSRQSGRKPVFCAAGWLALFALMQLAWFGRPVVAQTAQNIAGTWQGTMQVGDGTRIVLKISKAGGSANPGGWNGVYYSIDQEEQGRLVSSITLQESVLRFAIAAIDGRYEGRLAADGESIEGKWTQGKESYALNFVRAGEDTAWAIPELEKGMPLDADPAYDVVTIKPSNPTDGNRGFQTRGRRVLEVNETMDDLLSFAYGLHVKQIVGGPPWFATDRYYIEGIPDVAGEPNLQQFRSIVRKLLADRFNLKVHSDKRELSVYALTVAKGGAKIARSLGNPNGPPDDEYSTSAWMKERNTTMAEYAKALQYVLDKPVVDQTGLTGRFDFLLRWTPDESQFGGRIPSPADNPNAPPGLFTAIQEQIGLKLEPVKTPAEVIVVDHVERPSAN